MVKGPLLLQSYLKHFKVASIPIHTYLHTDDSSTRSYLGFNVLTIDTGTLQEDQVRVTELSTLSNNNLYLPR